MCETSLDLTQSWLAVCSNCGVLYQHCNETSLILWEVINGHYYHHSSSLTLAIDQMTIMTMLNMRVCETFIDSETTDNTVSCKRSQETQAHSQSKVIYFCFGKFAGQSHRSWDQQLWGAASS